MPFMDFFRPKWKHSDPTVRLAAVQGITDQAVLACIALTDVKTHVREAATLRVTDQDVLAEVAETAEFNSLGLGAAAVERITDHKLLGHIATNARKEEVRVAAVLRLTDQALLSHIATGDDDCSPRVVRKAAVSLLTDQSLLANIYKNDKSVGISCGAQSRLRELRLPTLECMTDQNALIEIAKNDEDSAIRATAVARVTDQSVLIKIAKNDNSYEVRLAAAKRVTDHGVLIDIARNHAKASVRMAAVGAVNDPVVLADVAKNDEDGAVREAAVLRAAGQSFDPVDKYDPDAPFTVERGKVSGSVRFSIKQGYVHAFGGNPYQPKYVQEDICLQYSIDSGKTWVDGLQTNDTIAWMDDLPIGQMVWFRSRTHVRGKYGNWSKIQTRVV